MGELRREIRIWCTEVRTGQADESELRKKLESILKKWGNTRVIRQDIGMAIQGYVTGPFELETKSGEKAWELADEVEPRIRSDYEKWAEQMKK